MSQQLFRTRASLRRLAGPCALAALLFGAASPSLAAPFLPAGCIADVNGANDVSGEVDVTRSCTEAGVADGFNIDSTWSIDPARLEGTSTIEVCSLYNTDRDAFANGAVCTTLRGAIGAGGNHIQLKSTRVYTCTDLSADRCSGAALIASPHTDCEASQAKEDPFPGPAPGPGDQYPEDTLVHCRVDTEDFLSNSAQPLDTCSYATASPDSAPLDCLLFTSCQGDADCDDQNDCTTDSCDASGVCRRSTNAGAPCSDGLWCNGDETCGLWGACGAATSARPCDDGIECTLDQCDEISDSCMHEARNSMCSDNLFCTGVEICDPASGCTAGTPPDCGDGIACTEDTCNESKDGCNHDADDACAAVLEELAKQ